ncbi:MAG: L-ribulose-5-phosphate 3-epimerase [Oscillospiraceae bacterium]|nr:L-ribulose-5-phosphate 3-epimerase [Oscillospiraceae bacterium]
MDKKKYLLGLYEKSMPNSLTLREKLQVTRESGFDFLELSIDETEEKLARLDWTDRELADLSAAQWETGCFIRSICLSGHRKYPFGHPDPAVQARSLEIMERAIALAASLGIRVIQLAGYDVYYVPGTEQTRADFGKNLRKCVDMAAREGVILAFETMETPFMNTVGKAMDWVREVNSPYLQVYPDVGNITNAARTYGTSELDDLESGRGHIAAVHLKETVPGVFREVPYGTGHVDFDAVIRKSLELGVRRFLAEFWYVGQEDWRQTIRDNAAFLRGKFRPIAE